MSIGISAPTSSDITVYGLLLLILFVRSDGFFAAASPGRRGYERLSRRLLVLLAVNVVLAYADFSPSRRSAQPRA